MNYLVTGATGFIGKFLLERLLARPDAEVHVLVRDGSRARFEDMSTRYGEAARRDRIEAHLQECTPCAAIYRDIAGTLALVGDLDVPGA